MDKDEPDLTGVHPLLWEKTRARIAAVEEYLRIPLPEDADEERLAQRLGIGLSHFRKLVSLWVRHRRASMLPDTSLSRVGRRRRGLAPEKLQVLEQVIAELGAAAPVADVDQEIRQRCDALGLKPPGEQTVRRRMENARISTNGGTDGERALVIDHCAVALPVRTEAGKTVVPVVTLAIAVPENVIVAHSVSLHTPSPQASATVLLEAILGSTSGADPRPVRMGRGRTAGWRRLETTIREGGMSLQGSRAVPVPCARALTKALGHKLGGIKLLPNLTHRPGEAAKAAVREIAAADVPLAVAQAVVEHNRHLGADPKAISLCLTHQSGMRLCARLGTLARQSPEEARPRITYPSRRARVATRPHEAPLVGQKKQKNGLEKKIPPLRPIFLGLDSLSVR